MKRYQIVELNTEYNHAGSKAVQDVYEIARSLGYEANIIRTATTADSLMAKIQRQIFFFIDWLKAYFSIASNSIVFIQNPYHHKQLIRNWVLESLKRKKNVKFISLVHDVEELRKSLYNNYYKSEFDIMLSLADVIIVHNDKMKDFFIKKGFPETKLVSLKIFDYLIDSKPSDSNANAKFERSISIAGNLDIKKSAYDIPNHLNSGFGLVWDGNSIDSCSGDFGEYLQYNNPHKLSLYLASGIPVVIWDKAAEAEFVKQNNLGLCVSSLHELKDKLNVITEQEFNEMVSNVEKQTNLLIYGKYTENSILEAEKII